MEGDTKCLRCGHIWKKRIDKPNSCPKCNNRRWWKPKIITTDIQEQTSMLNQNNITTENKEQLVTKKINKRAFN